MPKYVLEAVIKEEQKTHSEVYTHTETFTLTFLRKTDAEAIKYAFSTHSIDVRRDDKKLFKIDQYGGRRRLHPGD